jgi:hypothetical protein
MITTLWFVFMACVCTAYGYYYRDCELAYKLRYANIENIKLRADVSVMATAIKYEITRLEHTRDMPEVPYIVVQSFERRIKALELSLPSYIQFKTETV